MNFFKSNKGELSLVVALGVSVLTSFSIAALYSTTRSQIKKTQLKIDSESNFYSGEIASNYSYFVSQTSNPPDWANTDQTLTMSDPVTSIPSEFQGHRSTNAGVEAGFTIGVTRDFLPNGRTNVMQAYSRNNLTYNAITKSVSALDTATAYCGKISFANGAPVSPVCVVGPRQSKFVQDDYRAVAIQGDGKVVAAGAYTDFNDHSVLLLTRYNINGTIDTSFNNTGVVTLATGVSPTSEVFCEANAVAVQPDGKIVAFGNTMEPGNYSSRAFLLARYNSDGSLDTTFGNAGTVIQHVGLPAHKDYNTNVGQGLVLASDGKIVVVGMALTAALPASNSPTSVLPVDMTVARFNTDGTPDTSFGQIVSGSTRSGVQFIKPIPEYRSNAHAVAITADGSVVVTGSVYQYNGSANPPGTYHDTVVAKLTPSGDLDTTFGAPNGFAVFQLSPENYPDAGRGVTVQSSGKIVVAGYVLSAKDLNPGWWFSQGPDEQVGSVDGGYASTNSGSLPYWRKNYVLRLNLDGSLDSTFNNDGQPGSSGSGGLVITQFYPGFAGERRGEYLEGVVLDASDNIVVVGSTDNTVFAEGSMVRYLGTGATAGHEDHSFALNMLPSPYEPLWNTYPAPALAGGRLRMTFGNASATGDADGGFLRAIAIYPPTPVGSAIHHMDGKIVVAGKHWVPHAGWYKDHSLLLRYNSDGTKDLDYSF